MHFACTSWLGDVIVVASDLQLKRCRLISVTATSTIYSCHSLLASFYIIMCSSVVGKFLVLEQLLLIQPYTAYTILELFQH